MHLAAMQKNSAGFKKLLSVDSSAVLLTDYVSVPHPLLW